MKIDWKKLPQQVAEKAGKLSGRHKKFIVLSEILVLFILVMSVAYLISQKNWNAEKIVRSMIADNHDLSLATLTEEAKTEEPSEAVAVPYQSVAYFNDVLIKNSETVPYAGAVEVYENKQQALVQKAYYEVYNAELKTVFSVGDFGQKIADEYASKQAYVYVNGNVLLYLHHGYSSYQAEQMKKLFNQVVSRYEQSEKNLPDEAWVEATQQANQTKAKEEAKLLKERVIAELQEKINALATQLQEADVVKMLEIRESVMPYTEIPVVKQLADDVVNQIDDTIDNMAQEITDVLDEAEANLDSEAISLAQEMIKALEHPIFDEYKKEWDQRITQIQWAIREQEIRNYKAQCESYPYDDIVSDPDAYIGYYAYFYGQVVEVMSSSTGFAYRVNVTPVYSYFSDRILYWEDSIIIELDEEIETTIDEDDIIEMWGTLQGATSRTTALGGDSVVPQFYCRYLEKGQ